MRPGGTGGRLRSQRARYAPLVLRRRVRQWALHLAAHRLVAQRPVEVDGGLVELPDVQRDVPKLPLASPAMNSLHQRTPYATPLLVQAHRKRVHDGEVPGLEDPLAGVAVGAHADEAHQVADVVGNEHSRTGLADPLAKQRARRELILRCPEDVRQRFR